MFADNLIVAIKSVRCNRTSSGLI